MKKLTTLTLAACLALGVTCTFTGCGPDRYDRTTSEKTDDTDVSSRVRHALSDDASYKFNDVKVSTYKNTIQLSGFVQTAAQKSRAGEIAKGVAGGRNVENNITVRP